MCDRAGISRAGTLLVLLAAIGCGGDGPTAPASDGSRTPFALEVVAHGEVPGRITSDLWVAGDHAYTGSLGCPDSCGGGLLVWQLEPDGTPTLVDSVLVDARRVNDVKVSEDGRLGVLTHEGSADGRNGITLLDLTDPGSPEVITRYTEGLEPGVHNVFLDGDVLYAAVDRRGSGATGTAGGDLRILDVSDPAAPVTLASFFGGSSLVHDVRVRDGLSFVAHWDAGLVILDVGGGGAGGSPSKPVELGRVLLDGQTHNARYWPERELVFVGEEDFDAPGIVHVVDAADPTEPGEVASFRVAGAGTPPHNFWLDEARGVLWIAHYGEGVRALDVTGTLSGRLEVQERELASLVYDGSSTFAFGVQPHAGRIFVSDLNSGLWVLEER